MGGGIVMKFISYTILICDTVAFGSYFIQIIFGLHISGFIGYAAKTAVGVEIILSLEWI